MVHVFMTFRKLSYSSAGVDSNPHDECATDDQVEEDPRRKKWRGINLTRVSPGYCPIFPSSYSFESCFLS